MSCFKAKMHQIRFRLGLRPRPRWGSLQRSPRPLAGFKGPTSKGRAGQGRTGRERGGREGKGRRGAKGGGKGEGGEGEWGSPTHYFRLKSCTGSAVLYMAKRKVFKGPLNL